MREHLFRGKLSHSKKWIEGNLIIANNGKPYIIPQKNIEPDGHPLSIDDNAYWVIPETVGEWSGIKDKNDRRVFEGDLIKIGAEKEVFEIRFESGCFMAFCKDEQYGLLGELQQCFIFKIGNIHDNPELLEGLK